MIGMRYPFNLSEPLVIPRKKISTFVEAGLCIAYIWLCWDMLSERLVFWIPVGLFFGEGYPALAPCHPNQ